MYLSGLPSSCSNTHWNVHEVKLFQSQLDVRGRLLLGSLAAQKREERRVAASAGPGDAVRVAAGTGADDAIRAAAHAAPLPQCCGADSSARGRASIW